MTVQRGSCEAIQAKGEGKTKSAGMFYERAGVSDGLPLTTSVELVSSVD